MNLQKGSIYEAEPFKVLEPFLLRVLEVLILAQYIFDHSKWINSNLKTCVITSYMNLDQKASSQVAPYQSIQFIYFFTMVQSPPFRKSRDRIISIHFLPFWQVCVENFKFRFKDIQFFSNCELLYVIRKPQIWTQTS